MKTWLQAAFEAQAAELKKDQLVDAAPRYYWDAQVRLSPILSRTLLLIASLLVMPLVSAQ